MIRTGLEASASKEVCMRPGQLALFFALLPAAMLAAQSFLLEPAFNEGDGAYRALHSAGTALLAPLEGYLYYKAPPGFPLAPGGDAYLRVRYLDEAAGGIVLQYDGSESPYQVSSWHARSGSRGTGRLVDSFFLLREIVFGSRQNGGADFRIAGDLPIAEVEISASSCAELAAFLDPPWLRAYPEARAGSARNGDLRGLVLAGYQGWFRTPDDLDDSGWRHWFRGDRAEPEHLTVDMWPDPRDYPASSLSRAGRMRTGSGAPALVFSSTDPAVVDTHFRWMESYGIDGILLQRFTPPGGFRGRPEWVLANVRESAQRHGRVWAIEFDLSSCDDASVFDSVTEDWKFLVDECRILEDASYLRTDKGPLVVLWGFAFPDRDLSPETEGRLIDFFSDDPRYGGNEVAIGVFTLWRNQAAHHAAIRKADRVLVWMPQDRALDSYLLSSWGLGILPHIWPGFSWANLKRLGTDEEFTPRLGGAFFWNQYAEARDLGADCVFIGMFDEYDEGTAIMPMSDDPPAPPEGWGRFLTNEGVSRFRYLELAGAMKRDLARRAPPSSIPAGLDPAALPAIRVLPLRPGAREIRASLDEDGRQLCEGLALRMIDEESQNRPALVEGWPALEPTRPVAGTEDSYYFYAEIRHPEFRSGKASSVEIELRIWSSGRGRARLVYDSSDPRVLVVKETPGAWKEAGSIELAERRGWIDWKLEVEDGFFGGRCNGAELRIELSSASPPPLLGEMSIRRR